MRFIIISGMSGAGKSQAASMMEDMGFFCVDNLPTQLIPKFAELSMAGTEVYQRVVVVTDVRSGQNFDGLLSALNVLREMRCDYEILFMEASDETIIKRYKETRRSHPLAHEGLSLGEAVRQERELLKPVRALASRTIDTTALSTAKLRGLLQQEYGSGDGRTQMSVNVVSFGYKYGVPIEADLLFDVRFLLNPYYVDELRPLTGLDAPVRDFIMNNDQETTHFLDRLYALIDFLLPLYVEEGKSALVIGVGCTGGHHRSVAIAHELAEHIKSQGYQVEENHRDMTRS